ncbi:mitochondrial amidoxime reducing component 2-like isoform X1 [Thamnophis elegans]|uniref:mitochondrial amidoxime reducing component 2-like isoform X1 n=1 Tax=Thamnophis elegans TaxID=35005 RepID=UPI001378F0D2|nr:mitochondrial amidoxime reducing component 2-like isoform X1 [Thamnophis elegans]
MADFAALVPFSGLPPPLLLAYICTAAALLYGVVAAWRWQWSRRSRSPRLKLVGTVAALFIYPVKSCRGVSVKRAEMTSLGLGSEKLRDRFWTVIKEDGQMLSAKNIPRMVLISVSCEEDYLILNAPGMKTLRIPVDLPQTNSIWNCTRYGLQTQGRDCGDEAAEWITTFLNIEPYRLIHYETNMVTRKPGDFLSAFLPKDEVAYAEASPLLLISEASLDDLNTRLEKKASITIFRPNIVIKGCSPYEEDYWIDILIGTVKLKGKMSCPRCIFTAVDPETGIIGEKEVLKTLKSYRKCDPSEEHDYKSNPPFGWLYGVEETGTLEVGDPVYKIIS